MFRLCLGWLRRPRPRRPQRRRPGCRPAEQRWCRRRRGRLRGRGPPPKVPAGRRQRAKLNPGLWGLSSPSSRASRRRRPRRGPAATVRGARTPPYPANNICRRCRLRPEHASRRASVGRFGRRHCPQGPRHPPSAPWPNKTCPTGHRHRRVRSGPAVGTPFTKWPSENPTHTHNCTPMFEHTISYSLVCSHRFEEDLRFLEMLMAPGNARRTAASSVRVRKISKPGGCSVGSN